MSDNRENYPSITAKLAVTGEITARTGLHIGGSSVGLAIGGADSIVVRAPGTNRPYIPGSSLKGKLRSLLEKSGYARNFKVAEKNGKFSAGPCNCGQINCDVCQLFGVAAEHKSAGYIPRQIWKRSGRLSVRDGHMTTESAEEIQGWGQLSTPYGEVKTEVAIDRLTSQANPREFERVPAGARFCLEIMIDIHEGDNLDQYIKVLLDGLNLLANDYLGGQGTRGYGAVDINITSIKKLDVTKLSEAQDPMLSEPWDNVVSKSMELPIRLPMRT